MSTFSFIYNGFDFGAANGLTISRMQGQDGLPLRISEDTLVGRDGGNIWNILNDMRTITVEGTVRGDSVEDYFENKRALVDAVKKTNTAYELTITMWDGTTRSLLAKVVETPDIIEYAGENTYCVFQVSFKGESPYFVDAATDVQTVGIGVGGGFDIPFDVPFDLGETTGDTITITNSGDIAAYASFKISGSVTNAYVTNQTTGEFFSIQTNIPDGSFVRVGFTSQGLTVKLNDVTSYFQYYLSSSSPMFSIEPGANVIKFTASSSNANAELESTFRSNYLSL